MIDINISNFSYANTKTASLSDVSLQIQEGESVLLCGESGCGKTTITRLINGLIPHYYEGELHGSVRVNDLDITQAKLYETARVVGNVFQNPRSQFFCVDTTSEIAFGCENMGLPEDEIRQRVVEAADEMKVNNLLGRSIFELSGGEKQLVACTSVSAMQPEVMLLDEPTSNLDMAAIKNLRNVLLLWKKQGKTIIIAEHRLHWLSDICDRVITMNAGRITADCSMQEFGAMGDHKLTKMGLRPIHLDNLVPKNKCGKSSGNMLLSNFLFRYKRAKKPALDIGKVTLPKDQIVAVIGTNGTGKSTFAHCLCGLENRCKGLLQENGKTQKARQRLKSCYMVMQDVNHQLFTETILDEVLLSMPKPDETAAEEILDSLDLLSLKDIHPMSLSGGQKQRVAIASAVASQREIIVFDEPTSGLDLRHMKEVSKNLKQLCGQGRSLFIITHDQELILECCTHILHLQDGKVIGNYALDADGSQKLKAFFKSPEVNNSTQG